MKSQVKIHSVILAVAMCCLPVPALYSQIAIRSLPQTTPSASDLFPFSRPSGGTWVTDLTGILSTLGTYVISPSTVLNCTPPIQCNGGLSAYLNTPVTVSVTTSAFVSSGRQIFTPAPLVCDGAVSCDLSADRTLSLLACGPHTIMAGPVSGASPGSPSCVSALGNTVINQTFNSDTAYTSTRATDTSPTGNFQLFKNAAGGTLWQVDIAGSLAAGTVPVARVTGLATSATTDTTSASNITTGTMSTARISGLATSATTDTTNATNISSGTLNSARLPSIAHSSLTGLSSDDHTQYAFLAGRSGGQILVGDTASGGSLTIQSTSNGTRGFVFLGSAHLSAYDEVNNRLGIGTGVPAQDLNVTKSVSGGVESRTTNTSSNSAAQAVTRSQADVASGQMACYSSAFSTALFGVTPSSYCFYGISGGSGVIYGSTVSAPVLFGSNNVTRMTIPSGNNHLTFAGTAPTMTCTGVGSSPPASSCIGTDMGYTCTIKTGTTPGTTATCTVTYNAAMDTNKPPTVCMLVDGSSAWGIESSIHQTSQSLTAPIFVAVNVVGLVATNLTGSSDYLFHCITAPWK